MLLSTVFLLAPRTNSSIPKTLGNAFYRAFLELLGHTNGAAGRDLAAHLHDTQGPKPFTTSPLQGPFAVEGEQLRLRQDQVYWLRATSLDTPLSAMLDVMEAHPPSTIHLHGTTFRVLGLSSQASDHAWARRQTIEALYRSLWQRSSERKLRLTLDFASPTAFRARGRNTVLPVPRLVFGSLLTRWNLYAPADLQLDAALTASLDAVVDIDRYQLETHMLNYGRYQLQIGFVGACTFGVRPEASAEMADTLRLLAAYAFYAGVGYRTTMGMGQVRVVT